MAPPHPPEERQLVTVLFADLAGSTELVVRQDPEQLRALLSAFFEEITQQVRALGGTVEKLLLNRDSVLRARFYSANNPRPFEPRPGLQRPSVCTLHEPDL